MEHVRSLRVGLCYYQFIEYALDHGITRYEAGAQGAHKIARGFLPTITHSAHWIRHPGLDDAVGDFLVSEAEHVRAETAACMVRSPFREQVDVGGAL